MWWTLLGCGFGNDEDRGSPPIGALEWSVAGDAVDVLGVFGRASGVGVSVSGAGRVTFASHGPVVPAEALEATLLAVEAAGGSVARGPDGVAVSAVPEAVSVVVPEVEADGWSSLAGATSPRGGTVAVTPGGTVFVSCGCARAVFPVVRTPAAVAPGAPPAVEVVRLEPPALLVREADAQSARVVHVGEQVAGRTLVAITAGRAVWDPPDAPIEAGSPLPLSRADLERWVADPAAREAEVGRFLLHRGADGEHDGYRISGVRSGSVADAAGIKNGDVITRVGDLPFASQAEAEAAWRAVSGGDAFCVDLLRRAEPVRQCYTIGP